jgi:hypothetical protein
MRYVAVSEDYLVDRLTAAESLELRLHDDRNTLRIEPTGERRRITSVRDPGNLSRGESDDLNRRIVAIDDIEVVKVPSRGADDHDASATIASARRRVRYNRA